MSFFFVLFFFVAIVGGIKQKLSQNVVVKNKLIKTNQVLLSSHFNSSVRILAAIVERSSLHTAAEPAVRAAVKTELSHRCDTIIAFLFTANKNRDHAKVGLAGRRRTICGAKLEAWRQNILTISYGFLMPSQ